MSGPGGGDSAVTHVLARLQPPDDAVCAPFRPTRGALPRGVRLFDVRWPPPGPGRDRFRGAAVIDVPDGRLVLDLGVTAELGRLLAAVWNAGPALVAELTARYGRRGPFDVLITAPGDTMGAVEPGVVDQLGARPPSSSTGPDGHPQVSFHSFRLTPSARGGEIRAAVDGWTVTREDGDTVTIRTRELAADLPSPRYARR